MSAPTFFSQFTTDEQLLGLALDGKLTHYKQGKEKLEAAASAAQQRLFARPYVQEMRGIPGLDSQFLPQFDMTVATYFNQQEEALAAAQAGLLSLKAEWQSFSPGLATHAEVLQAIWAYRDRHAIEPAIDPDMPAPDRLAQDLHNYEQIVRGELESTRTLLSEKRPDLLEPWDFHSAQLCLQLSSGTGISVGEAADNLRSARTKLAGLRAQVN